MLQRAEANNARLLKAFPKGFALDAAHRPHITMVQRFVPAEDLDKVYSAVGNVLDSANVTAMNLVAFKYYYLPAPGGMGGAGICARPTPELLQLQADVIAAAAPFTVGTGTIAVFTAPHDNPALDALLIEYVSAFVPKYSGVNYNPHVSTGVGVARVPRRNARRTVRVIHVLARGRGCLPTRPVRHSCEETRRIRSEALRRR